VTRSQEAQRQRTQNNPLVLGSFDTTSLKYLKGRLGPLNQLVGRADTGQQSNGGFGGGTYNHWFQVNLKEPAWIIVAKAGPRPNYIQTSVYDLNKQPIEGRGIFQDDSVEVTNGTNTFYPYFATTMGAQSDLYNTFDAGRLDRGDERYYPLEAGGYLLCISTTRNELLDYEVGLVVEFPITEMFIANEDEGDISLFLQETAIDFSKTINVISPVTADTIVSALTFDVTQQPDSSFTDVATPITSNTTISSDVNKPNGFTGSVCVINSGITVTVLPGSAWFIGNLIVNPEQPNGFTEDICIINSGVTVTVLFGSEWFIGDQILSEQDDVFAVFVDADPSFFDSIHDHSLTEWQEHWENTHQDTDKFPEAFVPLTNRT
jgi:hypothetical protein